jgi:hypothetical protein
MAVKVSCPECSTTLRLPDSVAPGKRITCPKCGTGFPVPDPDEPETAAEEEDEAPAVRKKAARRAAEDEDEEDDRPARKRRSREEGDDDEEDDRPARKRRRDEEEDEDDDRPARKRRARDEDEDEDEDDRPRRKKKRKSGGGKGLLIGLLVGGAALFLVAAGVGVWFFFFAGNNPNVTEANFEKVKTGMSLDDVEKIFGKGKKATEQDLQDAMSVGNEPAGHSFPGNNPGFINTGSNQLYRWKNHKETMFVYIGNFGNLHQKVISATYVKRLDNGGVSISYKAPGFDFSGSQNFR